MDDDMRLSVIIPAAGKGERFGGGGGGGGKPNKLEAELGGRAVLMRSVELFCKRPNVKQIIVAANPDELDTFKFKWGDRLGILGVTIVAGGKKERWETVLRSIEAVDAEATHIAVHDAARPMGPATMIDRVFEAAKRLDAVIPAIPVSATLKRTEAKASAAGEGADPLDAILGSAGKVEIDAYKVTDTVSRTNLWLVQTPQVFRRQLLTEAYGQIAAGKIDTAKITDDAGLIEAMGGEVHIVMGDAMNVKITHPEDLTLCATLLAGLRAQKHGGDGLGPKRQFPTWAEMDED